MTDDKGCMAAALPVRNLQPAGLELRVPQMHAPWPQIASGGGPPRRGHTAAACGAALQCWVRMPPPLGIPA